MQRKEIVKRIEWQKAQCIPEFPGDIRLQVIGFKVTEVVYRLSRRDRKQLRRAKRRAEILARRTSKRQHPKREQEFAWDLYNVDLANLKQAKHFHSRHLKDVGYRECVEAFKNHRVQQYRKLP